MNNRRQFIKKSLILGLFAPFIPNLMKEKKRDRWTQNGAIYIGPIPYRYIYVKSSNPYSVEFLKNQGYKFPYMVDAIDLIDMCGFTPQDWNPTWMPDEKWKEVSREEFKKYAKNLKSVTTHFNHRWYCCDIDDFGIYKNKI